MIIINITYASIIIVSLPEVEEIINEAYEILSQNELSRRCLRGVGQSDVCAYNAIPLNVIIVMYTGARQRTSI